MSRWTVDPATPLGCVTALLAAGVGSLIGSMGAALLILAVLEPFR